MCVCVYAMGHAFGQPFLMFTWHRFCSESDSVIDTSCFSAYYYSNGYVFFGDG